MLLIKHSGGLITAYAHADKLLVARGDVVSRGQVIAWVGKSGDIDAPQLHFEVRKGSQAVDPRKFLPS
jgi:murein DD-endopeptidase MepM/ murein hydrolase activator NlpD